MSEEKQNVIPEEQLLLNALHLRIINALGIRKMNSEKLKKNLNENEENQRSCKQIVSHKNQHDYFIVIQNSQDSCMVQVDIDRIDVNKKKVLFFFKLFPDVLTPQNIKRLVFFEIFKDPLKILHNLFQHVMVPILQNPQNQKGWNELLSKDLMEKVNSFVSQIYLTIGKVQGKTLLPLPFPKIMISRDIPDKKKSQIFEAKIITWTKQIKKVLDTEPEHILRENPNPDPFCELNFWKQKSQNLNSICEQLQYKQVQDILEFLKNSKSTFINQFERLQKEIQSSRQEANENHMYLSTLEEYFKNLMDTSFDFMQVPDLFIPIMHSIMLIYENSNHYKSPSRIVLLIREICNAIIMRAQDYIPGESVISLIQSKEDIESACDRLQITIDVCTKFKDTYFEYKVKAKGKWKFPPNALFINLDNFLERCYDILHVTSSIQQFNQLENCKMGGTKGKHLTENVQGIYNEFIIASKIFHTLEYDIMNIEEKQFEDDFFNFRNKMKELERRLASAITQSFDDLETLTDRFKLLDQFEILLRRPVIQDELERKHIVLIENYKHDLKIVQSIFLENKNMVSECQDGAPIFNNLPPISGALNWAQSLERRIQKPFEKLQNLDGELIEKEEFKDLEKLYNQVLKTLRDFKEEKILEWEKEILESSEEKLNQFLLFRNVRENTLAVNFDPSLKRLLREVKYFYQLNIKIPECAAQIYNNDQKYRTQINKLDQIVYMYNKVVTNLNAVEEPLIIGNIQKMDKILEPGISKYQWKSQEVEDFISRALKTVEEVYKIVNKMKDDLQRIQEALQEFNKPMIERKIKSVSPEEFYTSHQASVSQVHIKIKGIGNSIVKLIKETNDCVKVDKKSKAWRDYQDYINDIIIQAISKAIITSMNQLNKFIDHNRRRDLNYFPWFEISVQLIGKEIQFSPNFEYNSTGFSIKGIMDNLINDFLEIAINIQRADTGGVGDYLVEMKHNFEIRFIMSQIYQNVDYLSLKSIEYKQSFKEFDFYIKNDPNECFQQFLKAVPKIEKQKSQGFGQEEEVTEEEINQKNPLCQNIITHMPSITKFDQQIQELKEVQQKIHTIKNQTEIDWLRIKADPLKKSLEQNLNQWIFVYINFLNKQVKTFIKNCKEFEMYLIDGITVNPQEHPEDKELLMKVMIVLSKHRLVNSQLDKNFSFVREMVNLLKKHSDFQFNKNEDDKVEDYIGTLDEIQTKFEEIFQQVIQVKTNILELQQSETEALKKRIVQFSDKVVEFRNEFKQNAPFKLDAKDTSDKVKMAYKLIDEYSEQIDEIKQEANKFNDLENLFELEKTKYKSLRECQNDVRKLRIMWGHIEKISNKYEKWEKVLWKNIKVDDLAPENENLNIMLKQVPREIKALSSYPVILERVQNMKKILNCIDMLHSEAMQPRHWEQISLEIGKQIDEKASNFCFKHILDVDIYKYEMIVQEITENANKELKMGKDLDKINAVWSKLSFEFESFDQAGGQLFIFKSFDAVQEILDNDTSKILSLLSQGKSVDVFRESLNTLKFKLNQVDSILNIWGKVQKNWKRLVNIFLLSEDIRNQLQDATKIFDEKNNQFRDIMSEVYINPKIMEVCTNERKIELEEIHKAVEECEKNLNLYLEEKKKAFARFYFVSNQTLIDILSNGKNIKKIATEYLADLFDGVRKIEMEKVDDQNEGGVMMVAKDGEKVKFQTPFILKDEIENWLSALEKKIRLELQLVLQTAKQIADEYFNSVEIKDNQKMDWIFDFCAQIALLTVQITWTDDVHKSFDDMEGGMSNAMRDCYEGIKKRINLLIEKVRSPDLTKELRNKIITIITIDVHSRDVVENLLKKQINDKESFQWYSQLKFYYTKECQDVLQNQEPRFPWEKSETEFKSIIRIVDWAKFYSYEYVGNSGRLVITPLTDRCYITLTQALSLNMGGAPAGPAGTGKTETTKDLGRACGLPVFVFNCSEQMNTDSLGQVFMGLSQTGAWGCFDEFNRITIEVLSVVSTQVKQILDALREKRQKFIFMEEEISLQDTVGFFITMNPGYAGRTELPENLKALFRSCAMVVPNLMLICENMLMSEGYTQARELAKKFVTLYNLSKTLLSKQKHYDWGLRAVKSVLRQAGKLKRQNEGKDENLLLFGALKDFNLPKIVTDDKPIFINLLKDLFTSVEKVPKVIIDESLRQQVVKIAKQKQYIAEEQFVLKIIQLSEILEVRHCVFIIGPAGCGKSAVWKTLASVFKSMGQETEIDCLDPKAVSSDELFGTLTKSKEFKNGVLSSIIKNQCKNQGKYKASQTNKWSILDGDIDPEWIESLNTVMDDNKVLTLVSNDRFPLTPAMRLLFEISNLKQATPATVSRAGVLYINDSDIGWKPFFDSWLDSHKKELLNKQIEQGLTPNKVEFDALAISVFLKCQQYFDNPDMMRLVHVVPVVDIMMVETTCTIIDGYLFKYKQHLVDRKEEDLKLLYEGVFLYAAMWGIGGTFLDSGEDEQYYREFHRLWKGQAKIKYPDIKIAEGKSLSIFDFQFDMQTLQWIPVDTPKFNMDEDISFTKLFVPTMYTERLWQLTELHAKQQKPLMYVGNAGTGKTALMNKFISTRSQEIYLKNTVNFSSLTTSESLQENLMSSGLSKLGMRLWGLGSGRTLMFFIDDINMPYVDIYGTQSPIALIRQIIDYQIVYDRDCLEEYNKLQDIYFCACLNPKSGSFYIDLRLQRHFSVFCLPVPNNLVIKQIYKSILSGHFSDFGDQFQQIPQRIVDATVNIYQYLIRDTSFNPSAKKFHYQFNLRELSKVTEGVMLSTNTFTKLQLSQLWVHECRRVFGDRLVFEEDQNKFDEYLNKAYQTLIDGEIQVNDEEKQLIMGESNIFTSFISIYEGESDKIYLPVESMDYLKKILQEKLQEYNENKAQMNLVLFKNAIMHICRISRILDRSNGHALLIGVGGSGKQSLTKLSAFLQNYELETLPSGSINLLDFKAQLGDMMKKATKPPGSQRIFMITDVQIENDQMLISLNDMLSNGYIPGLWPREELDGHLQTMKTELRQKGIQDSPENLYEYFLEKLKKNVHLVLCMSPVGDALRIRARKFPAIINQTMINWFHSWPKDALQDVAHNFLKEIEFPLEGMVEKLAANMSETHAGIDEINKQFLLQERRYNYTTPKSYLELIEFYKVKLQQGRDDINHQIDNLQRGLNTLSETQNNVKGIEEDLKVVMEEVKQKKESTEKLIQQVNEQKAFVEGEQQKANEEEAKTMKLAAQANLVKEEADKAYKIALPKLQKAQEALSRISEQKISIMKNLKTPPALVVLTGKVLVFIFKGEKVDLFSDKDNDAGWKKAVNTMNNVKRFLQDLKHFSSETAKTLDSNIKDKMNKLINSGKFNINDVMSTSSAAGNLADWAHNIISFNEAFNIVEPLEAKKNEAEEELRQKNIELDKVKEQVRKLNDKLKNLENNLAKAEDDLAQVEAEKQKFQNKLERADKLVKGLASENERWSQNVEFLQTRKFTVIGDTLLAAEFVCYIGPFNSHFRDKLWKDMWINDIKSREIPITDNITPLEILTNNAKIAKWKNQGLPEDNMSLQNATIITSCQRWPLIIDPQLQGTNWLKGFYQELVDQEEQRKENSQQDINDDEDQGGSINELLQFSLNNKKSYQKLKLAISYGKKVLLESITEEIDSALDPLLSRSVIKKSTTYYLKVGQDQIEYSPDFKLYLQCKRQNPHFRPETSAQCTIINFIVTEKGLEDQLLAMVVNHERQELELKKQSLVRQQNDFEVTLSNLEVSLLESLSAADPKTILENTELIENLDQMKKTAIQIQQQKEEAKVTEVQINREREKYRVLAQEGAMLYFLIITLQFVDHMYQYSLESFINFFFKAIKNTTVVDETRVSKLVLNIRKTVYQWISRGLFERHKIIFLTMLTFRLLQKGIIKTDWNINMMNYLLNCIPKTEGENTLKDWLPNQAWFSVLRLAEIEEFEKLPDSIEKELPARFKDWFNELNPENIRLPSEWRKLEQQPFLKLCVIRALRPDRMTAALINFINNVFPEGQEFISMDQNHSFNEILQQILQDATDETQTQMNTPIFFILSPGADPVKEVEKIGKKHKFEYNLNNFFNIALGQGQDVVADSKLEAGFKEGYWVMLQNIHLMPSWLDKLEKKLEQFSKEDGFHQNFRLFLSAEPNKQIPVGILEKCIKLTNEPPAGLKANMKRAWTYFNKDEIDEKDTKYNHILFALCYFHSVLIERRKFGPKGWNMFYPFNIGDLRDSYLVLCKNAENNSSGKIPWDDLKYIFGEIMYGGHIVDDWDRRLCNSYLEYLLVPNLCMEDFELYPFVDAKKNSLKVPPSNSKFVKYLEQIETSIKQETPIAYGLHPNAEIDLGTTQCQNIFNTLIELLPKDTKESNAGTGGPNKNAELYYSKVFFDYNLKERLFCILDIKDKIVEMGPFQNVFIQECEYMNALITEITRSLYELDQGIKGILTITEKMESLLEALDLERIPESWQKLAYRTKRYLGSFLDNMVKRIDQLSQWKDDPQSIPKVTRINMLFNPQSFLTAIKQYSKKGDLNTLQISTEFTKKSIEEIEQTAPKDGAYCYGFLLEGAKWDWQLGQLEDARPKEMFSTMPVCLCRAIPIPKKERKDNNLYQCPVYRTIDRGDTYIFEAQLKTSSKNPPRKWILGGVAIILDVEGISDEIKTTDKK